MMFTKEQLIEDLKKLGVKEGDHIGLGISFKSIGSVSGGPDTLIDALIEAVGSNGTIMIPTFTKSFHSNRMNSGKIDYVFDYRTTPANTGIVPNILRKRSGALRSHHPIYSVAALGRLSEYLTEGHDEKSRPFTPYSKLAEARGKVLSIGIGNRLVAFRHEAQHKAGLLLVLSEKAKFRADDGHIKLYVEREPPGCVARLPELVLVLRESGLVKEGNVGNAKSIIVPAKESLDMMTDLLISDPTLNLCHRVYCLWCRELEREMNLYERIKNPKYFQKNVFIIKGITLINRLRINDSTLIRPLMEGAVGNLISKYMREYA
jgi:aminoglycoside 3-N-acetyltransferase